MGWMGYKDKELKKFYYRYATYGIGTCRKFSKIRMDYPNCYFRRIGKKEIEEQRNDF